MKDGVDQNLVCNLSNFYHVSMEENNDLLSEDRLRICFKQERLMRDTIPSNNSNIVRNLSEYKLSFTRTKWRVTNCCYCAEAYVESRTLNP